MTTDPTDNRELWGIVPEAEYSELVIDLGDGGGATSYHCYTLGDERILLMFDTNMGAFFISTPILQVRENGEWVTVPDEEEDDDTTPTNRL